MVSGIWNWRRAMGAGVLTALVLLAGLYPVSECVAASFTINWTYQYGVNSQGKENESVFGHLSFKGDELPGDFGDVITPIGEFIYRDRGDAGASQKIDWVPYGNVPGVGWNAAHMDADVQLLLASDDKSFRRVIITGTMAATNASAIPGTFDSPPAGVGRDWFYAVKRKLWVNPDRVSQVEADFAAHAAK